jgi:hypothetical protein
MWIESGYQRIAFETSCGDCTYGYYLSFIVLLLSCCCYWGGFLLLVIIIVSLLLLIVSLLPPLFSSSHTAFVTLRHIPLHLSSTPDVDGFVNPWELLTQPRLDRVPTTSPGQHSW